MCIVRHLETTKCSMQELEYKQNISSLNIELFKKTNDVDIHFFIFRPLARMFMKHLIYRNRNKLMFLLHSMKSLPIILIAPT